MRSGLKLPEMGSGADRKKKSLVLIAGDSITRNGSRSGGFIRIMKKQIRKRGWKIELKGTGVSGNRVPDLQKRLQKDVLNKKPVLTVIMIGVNDVWHREKGNGTPPSQYRTELLSIVKRIQETGSRVILCPPALIGEKTDGTNTFDPVLEDYCSISRETAENAGSLFLDLRSMCFEYLKQNNPENLLYGILTRDGVHLNAQGNRMFASWLMEAIEKSQKVQH